MFKIKWMSGVLLIVLSIVAMLSSFAIEDHHETITLEIIEDRIVNYNNEVLRASEVIKNTEYKLYQANEDKYNVSTSDVETRKNLSYYPKLFKMNLLDDEWKKEILIENKYLEALDLYYSYQIMLEELIYRNNIVDRLKEELELVDMKIVEGSYLPIERMGIEVDIANEEFSIQKLVNERERLFLDLNVVLGYDLDTPLVIEGTDLSTKAYFVDNIEDHIEYVLVTDESLEKLLISYDLMQIELEIFEDFNDENRYDDYISKLKMDIELTEYDIKNLKSSLEYDVRKKYNDVLNAYDLLTIKEIMLENSRLDFEVVSTKYEADLVNHVLLLKEKEKHLLSEINYKEAVYDYILVVEGYKNLIE